MQYHFTTVLSLPGIKAATAFISGIVLVRVLGGPPLIWLLVAAISFPLMVIAFGLGRHGRWGVICLGPLLFAALGGFAFLVEDGEVDSGLLWNADRPGKIILRGVVRDRPQTRKTGLSFPVYILDAQDSSLAGTVRGLAQVYTGDAAVQEGDTVILRGALRSPRPSTSPGGFDFREHLRMRGLAVTLVATGRDGVRVIGPAVDRPMLSLVVEGVRSWLESGLDSLFHPAHSGLMKSLLLGDRGLVDEDTEDSFRKTGVVHILSVSGSHVAMILTMLWLVLGRLPFAWRVGVLIPILLVYAAVTGGDAPVVRSVLMSCALLSATLVQRPASTLNILALTSLIILAIHPRDVFHVGFQLSFASVLALVVLAPTLHHGLLSLLPRRYRKRMVARGVAASVAVTLAAQAGTLPFIVGYFGQVSPISFIANPVVAPLVFIAMAGGLTGILIHVLWPGAGLAFATAAATALDLARWSTAMLAQPTWSSTTLPNLPLWFLFALGAVILFPALSAHRRLPRFVILALGLAATVAWIPRAEDPEGVVIDVLDVGQGDAIVLRMPDRHVWLVDSGPSSRSADAAERVLLPYFRHEGISRIEALVITHTDDDHLGGAQTLLSSLPIGKIITSGRWESQGLPVSVETFARSLGIPILETKAGQRLDFGQGPRLYVLGPPERDSATISGNETSLVMRIQYGTSSVLLTGDAEIHQEGELVNRWGPLMRTDILKCGHHGSRTSTSEELLSAVRPRLALISCGKLNRFQHPHPRVIDRLRGKGIRNLRTDIHGSIRLHLYRHGLVTAVTYISNWHK